MIEGYRIAPIPLHFPEEREQLRAFLARHQLRYESDIQSAFGIYNEEDNTCLLDAIARFGKENARGCVGRVRVCSRIFDEMLCCGARFAGAECAWTSGFLFDAGALFCRIL